MHELKVVETLREFSESEIHFHRQLLLNTASMTITRVYSYDAEGLTLVILTTPLEGGVIRVQMHDYKTGTLVFMKVVDSFESIQGLNLADLHPLKGEFNFPWMCPRDFKM